MAHESYLSDKDYPYWWEHSSAPSFEQLAGIVEQVEACVRELPLAEAAELPGPRYYRYLCRMCRIYAADAAQAQLYLEALQAAGASSLLPAATMRSAPATATTPEKPPLRVSP